MSARIQNKEMGFWNNLNYDMGEKSPFILYLFILIHLILNSWYYLQKAFAYINKSQKEEVIKINSENIIIY